MTSQRIPVETRGRRVLGLYSRTLEEGREVFEYRGRLNGRVVTRKLEARTRSEAVAESERLRSQARSEGSVLSVDRRLTVDRLAELFGAAVDADPTYSPRTREDLHSRLRKHIIPNLRSVRVCVVDAVAIRRFARSLPPMRAKTHRNIISVCSAMFTWAVGEGLAIENPVTRARERFPRDLRRTDEQRFEPRALTDDELAAALPKVSDTYRPLIAFVAETGARVSEAIGIKFADVDLHAGTWTIAGQLDADRTIRRTKTPREHGDPPALPRGRRHREGAQAGTHAHELLCRVLGRVRVHRNPRAAVQSAERSPSLADGDQGDPRRARPAP